MSEDIGKNTSEGIPGLNGPNEDCRNPKHALIYVRNVLTHLHNFIGVHHAAAPEQRECEFAIQCIDAALHTLMPLAVEEPNKFR